MDRLGGDAEPVSACTMLPRQYTCKNKVPYRLGYPSYKQLGMTQFGLVAALGRFAALASVVY